MAAHQAQEMIRAIELDAAHTCSAQLEEVSALKRKLEETAGQLMKELEEKTVVKNLLEEQKQVALDLQQVKINSKHELLILLWLFIHFFAHIFKLSLFVIDRS